MAFEKKLEHSGDHWGIGKALNFGDLSTRDTVLRGLS